MDKTRANGRAVAAKSFESVYLSPNGRVCASRRRHPSPSVRSAPFGKQMSRGALYDGGGCLQLAKATIKR